MKANRLNYKLLSKLMLPLAVAMIFVVYRLAISRTIEQYQVYQELTAEDRQDEALSVSPSYTRERAAAISRLFGKFLIDTLSWKNQLWNQSATCSSKYGCTLEGFPEEKKMNYEDLVLSTQTVVFSGSFHQLLRLQQNMDSVQRAGRITALSYQTEKQTGQIRLTMKLAGLPENTYK